MTRPSSTPVLVLGAHRSGTSAVTRILNLLGVDLGDDLMRPLPDNPHGFWEHARVYELHESILARLGSSWDDVRRLPEGWVRDAAIAEQRAALRELIREEFSHRPLWGVKDPRLCRLLPIWLELLGELELEPRFVIVVRNPLEVAGSLATRNGFSKTKSLILHFGNMLEAIEYTEAHRRVFVSFAALLESWRLVVEDIWRALDLERREEVPSAAIEAYLRPSERHHASDLAELEDDPSVPPWAAELAAELEAAGRARRSELAGVVSAARAAMATTAPLVLPELHRLSVANRHLESERDALAADRAGLEERLAGEADRLEALEQTRRKVEERAADLEDRRQQIERDLQEEQARREAVEADARRLSKDLEAEGRQREAIDAEFTRLEGERRDLAERLGETQRRIATLEGDAKRAAERLARRQLELEARTEERARLIEERDGLQARLAEIEADNERQARQVARLGDELNKVQGHLTTILSSRLFRYTRGLRQVWYRLKGGA